MFQKFIQLLQQSCERFIVFGLRRCMDAYSVVIAKEFNRVDAEAQQFRSEVRYVAADHFRSLQALHARLSKLEGQV